MQTELDKGGQLFKDSLKNMRKFVDMIGENKLAPFTPATAPFVAAKQVLDSDQTKTIIKHINDVGNLSDEMQDRIDEVKELKKNKNLFSQVFKGNNDSYAKAWKRTFEDGLVHIKGKGDVTLKEWWNDGSEELEESIKNGVKDILDELNPFKALSTAKWTVALIMYKRVINEKYRNYHAIIANQKEKYFKGFKLGDDGENKEVEDLKKSLAIDEKHYPAPGWLNVDKKLTFKEYLQVAGDLYGYLFFEEYDLEGVNDIAQYFELNSMLLRSRDENAEKVYNKIREGHQEFQTKYNEEKNNVKSEMAKDVGQFEIYRKNGNSSTPQQEGTEFEKLIVSGPDFIPNHYDAAFYWDNSSEKLEISQLASITTNPREKIFLTPNGLAVRMTRISVPQLKNKAFDINCITHGIKKLSSMHDISRKATFTFRLDSSLAWLNFFGSMIGEKNFYEGKISDKETFVHLFANSFSSGDLNNNHLCLAVKLRNLSTPVNGQEKYYRVIVFRDVKFTGTDNLKYSSDGGISEMSIEFIYKNSRIYKTGEDTDDGRFYKGGYSGRHEILGSLWKKA